MISSCTPARHFADLKLHYITIGGPNGIPIVVLHGSGSSARRMLTAGFAGELFGPGQPFDAAKYFIIIPDALGHGESGIMAAAMKRVKNGKLYRIPASTEPTGHLINGDAKFYKQQLQELLASAPRQAM
jgi:homoserine acetyltransferase